MKRFLALALSFVMVLSMLPVEALALTAEEADWQLGMHFIIRQWHAVPDPDSSSSASGGGSDVRSDNSIVIDGYIVPVGSGYEFYLQLDGETELTKMSDLTDEQKTKHHIKSYGGDQVVLSVDPYVRGSDDKVLESYSGTSISAGHTAVEYSSTEVTIKYDAGIHLVKGHVFYLNESIRVNGSDEESVFGDPNDQANWQKDTSIEANWVLDSGEVLNDVKIYNTSVGLHTDKTASAAYENPKTSDEARTFNIDLEAWYINGNAPVVGIVLDASGSMGFNFERMEPIKLTDAQLSMLSDAHIGQVTKTTVQQSGFQWENYFIPNTQLDQILNPHKTDNSPLSSSGYSYFVYGARSGVKEYAPLAYWDGTLEGTVAKQGVKVIGEPHSKYRSLSSSDRVGWYYINPTSNWIDNYVKSGLESGKTLHGTPTSDYIYADTIYMPAGVDLYSENTNQSFKPAKDAPIRFYVDAGGYLRCFACTNSGNADAVKYACSYVYESSDMGYIKVEALQRALGAFVNKLSESSPASKVAATRFSTNNEKQDSQKLVLLDWTSNPGESAKILSLERGTGGTINGTESTANGKTVIQYNYGLTGDTSTWRGIDAFNKYLAYGPGIQPDTEKFLIIFTDGKDTDRSNENSGQAKKLVEDLKTNYGYNVITVMLAGGAVAYSADPNSDYAGAKDFLLTLSGMADGSRKAEDLFFSTGELNNPDGLNSVDLLTEIFTDEIINLITDTLPGYTMKDYIDPRFDLVDANGVLWELGAQGKVTKVAANNSKTSVTVSANGTKITLSTWEDVDQTAREAMLKYDTRNDMYYLEWTNQTIPIGSLGVKKLAVWNARFTIRAKEDFIGGNIVLTNGHNEMMNYVYHPSDSTVSSGVVDSKNVPEANGSFDFPSKGFPRTTVNVKLPPIGKPQETIIYMGERVIQSVLTNEIEQVLSKKGSEKWYWDYLLRYDNAFPNEHVIDTLIQSGSVDLPYCYLLRMDASNQVGPGPQAGDALGTMTYSWETIGITEDGLPTKDTKKREVRLTVKYTPFTSDQRVQSDANNNGVIVDNIYKWDRLYKKEVPDEINGDNGTFNFVVNIVSGEVHLQVKLTREDVAFLQEAFPGGTLTYNANLTRTYGSGIVNETIGTYTATYKIPNDLPAGDVFVDAVLTYNTNYANHSDSEIYSLPIGTYEVIPNKSSNTALYTFTSPQPVALSAGHASRFERFGNQIGETNASGQRDPGKLPAMAAPYDTGNRAYLGTGTVLDRSRVYTDERYALLEVTIQHAADAVPQTGDNSNIQMWLALMFVAIGAMVAFYPRRRAAKDRQ